MINYEFKNHLATKDFLRFAAIQLLNPIIQILYIAVSFLSAFVLRIVYPALSVLPAGFGVYSLLLLSQFISTACTNSKNHQNFVTTLGYQKTGINEKEYIEYYQSSVSEIKWRQFQKIKERKKYFILNHLGKHFIILPKKLLPDGCVELIRQMAANLKERGTQNGKTPSCEEGSGVCGCDIDGGIEVYRKPADSVAFQLYHSYVRRKFLIIITAFAMILIVCITFLSSFTGEYLVPLLLFIMLAALHLFMFLVYVVSSRADGKQSYRMVYLFTDEGCEVAHRFGKNYLEWNKFYSVKWTDKYFYLYLGKNQAYILPKRYLTPDAIQLLKDLVHRYGLDRDKPKRERVSASM